MSNRFHNKWHRHNHHTYSTDNEADSRHDPIASPSDPFKGDFVLYGSISSYAPSSAVNCILNGSQTALSAVGQTIGILTSSTQYGIVATGGSTYTGSIMSSSWSVSALYPDMTYPSISGNTNANIKGALSAASVWSIQSHSVSGVFQENLQVNKILNVYDTISASKLIAMGASGVITVSGGNSNKWNNVYNNVNTLSSNWNSVYTNVYNISSLWSSVYTQVNANSSNWLQGYNTYLSVNPLSSNWNSVYTNVNETSSIWNGDYTNKIINITNISSNNVSLTGNLTFANNISALTFTNRISTSSQLSASPLPTAWSIVKIDNIEKAIPIYNFNII